MSFALISRPKQTKQAPLAVAPALRTNRFAGALLQRKCACGDHYVGSGTCQKCSQKKPLGLQTKLQISESGDIYEQEAERIADQVMAMTSHFAVGSAPLPIQRLPPDAGQTDASPDGLGQAFEGTAIPLEPSLRSDMERRFGYDFSRVRVHISDRASESAAALGASAYTVGQQIVFGRGRFEPGSTTGQRLVAHELAHTIQQSRDTRPSIQRSPDERPRAGSVESGQQRESHLRSGDTLTYRQAKELVDCLNIMGEESGDYCRQIVVGEPTAQSVSSAPLPPHIFQIVLDNLSTTVRSTPKAEVETTITDAFGPLAKAAGRELKLVRRAPGELLLDFDSGGAGARPCAWTVLGNEGGGEIFVGAHRDLRVCGSPERVPDPSGLQLTDELDYQPAIDFVFDENEKEFGRFVGNTAVHELGHMIAKLPHTSDKDNYMFAVGKTGANLPQSLRTRAAMRLHWGSPMTFNSGQADQLTKAIGIGQFSGGMQTTPVNTPPITTRPKGSLMKPRPRDTGHSEIALPVRQVSHEEMRKSTKKAKR